MEENQRTVEDIERRQRLTAVLFKVFVAILILIGCFFVGWLISFVGYAHESLSIETTSFAQKYADSAAEIGRRADLFLM